MLGFAALVAVVEAVVPFQERYYRPYHRGSTALGPIPY